MIFVTVGEQLPFERLIRAVDECAPKIQQQVFAQIGDMEWIPQNIDYKRFLDPREFEHKFKAANLVVAHAGMGTIITAMELGKQIVVMPRRAAFKEHRNDHQFATVNRFVQRGYIQVASDGKELKQYLLKHATSSQALQKQENMAPSSSLIKAIADFIL